MKAWIATQRHWLVVEQLPGYVHDLNPIEMVWGNIKGVELANLCPDTIDEARVAAEAGLQRVGTSYELCMHSSNTVVFLCESGSLNLRKVFNVGPAVRHWSRGERPRHFSVAWEVL